MPLMGLRLWVLVIMLRTSAPPAPRPGNNRDKRKAKQGGRVGGVRTGVESRETMPLMGLRLLSWSSCCARLRPLPPGLAIQTRDHRGQTREGGGERVREDGVGGERRQRVDAIDGSAVVVLVIMLRTSAPPAPRPGIQNEKQRTEERERVREWVGMGWE